MRFFTVYFLKKFSPIDGLHQNTLDITKKYLLQIVILLKDLKRSVGEHSNLHKLMRLE